MSISSLLASDLASAYSLYTTNSSSSSTSASLSATDKTLLTAFDQALSTTTGGAAASSTKSSTAGSPVAQDLQSFVQDLFSVLHQASRAHTKSSATVGKPVTTPTVVKNTPAPKAPNIITPHINASATATVASADASASKTTDSTTATSTAVAATSTASTASSKVAQYQQSGAQSIIAALKILIQDVSSGEVLGSSAAASVASSSLSAGTLTNLQNAFSKLAGDLDATTSSTASSPSTSSTSSASTKPTATASTTSAKADASATAKSRSAATHSGTAAFKTFLTTFLHDLQSGGATSGKLVNTKA